MIVEEKEASKMPLSHRVLGGLSQLTTQRMSHMTPRDDDEDCAGHWKTGWVDAWKKP